MTIPIPLQEALRDSITSGTFVDTKFWVFSKRGSKAGRVGEPKELFANGHVAKRMPRLGALLDERGTKENLRAGFPTGRRPYTNHYEYEDDSDFEEDDDDDDILDDEPTPGAPQVAVEKPGNNSDVVAIENSDAKNNESSDIISVSDLDSLLSESSDTGGGDTGTASSAHIGNVIIIEDVAFVTFQALLRYLYTNEIEFAPWGSTERRKARALEKISESYGIPKPSSKSIYRLADKYDIPELKELALRQIHQDLSKCNVVEEAFSKYTSWYPELRELELRQLARVLLSSDSGATLGLLKKKIKSYTHGHLPHAEHIFPALYKFMESDESIKETPLPAVASPNQQVTGGDWDGLKKALTSSLTSGMFLDSQFYAVESRLSAGSLKIQPIYFCSTVGGSFGSKLVEYSSKLKARKAPLPRCGDGYDSDIDDEDPDPEDSMECHPCSKCVRENPTPANSSVEPALLLRSGAAKTWSAIFLYVYAGQITFANICSQDVTSEKETRDGCSQDERKPPQDSGGLSTPSPGAVVLDPCSPKSIYCLANKVGLTGLCDIAFKDIQSKLDGNNIVQELFSPFTANHKCIREMEHELFQSKLKPSVDGDLLSDIIQSASSGENPHHTAAMELIFERSILERRERMFTKAKDSLQPDPTPQHKVTSEAPDISILQVQSLTPPPASQPPAQSPNAITDTVTSSIPASAKDLKSSQDSSTPTGPTPASTKDKSSQHPAPDISTPQVQPPAPAAVSQRPSRSPSNVIADIATAKYESPQDSSALSKKIKKTAQREEPPADAKVNPSPSEDVVQLACQWCSGKKSRNNLRSGIYCGRCLWAAMKCTSCGTIRSRNVEACTKCHRKFK